MSADPALPVPALVTTFTDLGLPPALVSVLSRRGISVPTPIQAGTLPHALAGRDVLGRGPTGSGKTYAFLLPLVARLAAGRRAGPGRPRALVLAPTRELASQIEVALAPLAAVAGLRSATVFGGVSQHPQVSALRRGVDILVACPGRLEDLMGQGHVDLGAVDVTVLDEADHMADLGFLPVVRRIMDATPAAGQRLLFSATLDAGVAVLVKRFLTDPVTHHAGPAQAHVPTMAHHVLQVRADDRLPVLVELTARAAPVLVFTRTKHGAKKLARQLTAAGVPTVELHGNLSQVARTRSMDRFHSGAATTLVATDIAARGIHVSDVEIVVHADPPTEHKAYLHRSGRTARAGADGLVVTLATDEQMRDVRDLTRKAGVQPTTTRVHPTHPLLHQLTPSPRARPRTTTTAAAAARPTGPTTSPSTTARRPATGSRRRGRPGTTSSTITSSTRSSRSGGAAAFSAARGRR